MSYDFFMEKVYFVEQVEFCLRGIIMLIYCVEEVLFWFYKENVMIIDVEKFFYDIRLNKQQDLFIQFNFCLVYSLFEYVVVLEFNFYILKDLFENKKDQGLVE